MQDCTFCKIAAHEIPVNSVYEDDAILAFPDIAPQAPTHLLIIPKTHHQDISEASAEILGILLHRAGIIGGQLLPQGYRVVVNTGANGGQTVQHLHLHLLGNRQMLWPPG